jgi:hypothetical protein
MMLILEADAKISSSLFRALQKSNQLSGSVVDVLAMQRIIVAGISLFVVLCMD